MATERLTCKLSDRERDVRAREGAELVKEFKAKEEYKSRVSKTLGAELKEVRARMEEASRAAREGHEEREVEVETRNNLEDLTIETWRLDTMEIVRAVGMTDEQKRRHRQQRFKTVD